MFDIEGFELDKMMTQKELRQYAKGEDFISFEKEFKILENNTCCDYNGFQKYAISFLNLDLLDAFVERYKNIEKNNNIIEMNLEDLYTENIMKKKNIVMSREDLLNNISLKNIIKEFFVLKDCFIIASGGREMKEYFMEENKNIHSDYEIDLIKEGGNRKELQKTLLQPFFKQLEEHQIFSNEDWEEMVKSECNADFPKRGVYNWAFSQKISDIKLEGYIAQFLMAHKENKRGYAKDLFELISDQGFKTKYIDWIDEHWINMNGFAGNGLQEFRESKVPVARGLEEIDEYKEIIEIIKRERREALLLSGFDNEKINKKKNKI